MADGFRFINLSFAFGSAGSLSARCMGWLGGCKHERRCSQKSQMEDMTGDVSDVTHQKRGVRFEKSQLVERESGVPASEEKGWTFGVSSWPDEFVRYGRRALVGLRADDVKAVSIKGLCLSLLMSKTLLTQR